MKQRTSATENYQKSAKLDKARTSKSKKEPAKNQTKQQ
jgi:hypothetical protein